MQYPSKPIDAPNQLQTSFISSGKVTHPIISLESQVLKTYRIHGVDGLLSTYWGDYIIACRWTEMEAEGGGCATGAVGGSDAD